MLQVDICRVIVGADIFRVVPDNGVRDLVEARSVVSILIFRLYADRAVICDSAEIEKSSCVVLCGESDIAVGKKGVTNGGSSAEHAHSLVSHFPDEAVFNDDIRSESVNAIVFAVGDDYSAEHKGLPDTSSVQVYRIVIIDFAILPVLPEHIRDPAVFHKDPCVERFDSHDRSSPVTPSEGHQGVNPSLAFGFPDLASIVRNRTVFEAHV